MFLGSKVPKFYILPKVLYNSAILGKFLSIINWGLNSALSAYTVATPWKWLAYRPTYMAGSQQCLLYPVIQSTYIIKAAYSLTNYILPSVAMPLRKHSFTEYNMLIMI